MRAHWLDEGESHPIMEETLGAHGIVCESLPLEKTTYDAALDAYQQDRGYGTRDEIALTPATENLDAICAKFLDEHHHEDDEVRFVLEGEGLFDIRSNDDRWMRVRVGPGDLIIVPAGKHHRFMLTDLKTIRCVRLFQDPAGWAPVYRQKRSA
jgi:1,2-dihydroxy-3-keto-5-methylthiopentene dioxygenase